MTPVPGDRISPLDWTPIAAEETPARQPFARSVGSDCRSATGRQLARAAVGSDPAVAASSQKLPRARQLTLGDRTRLLQQRRSLVCAKNGCEHAQLTE